MDVQAIWLVVLAVATPVAGVVGFAIKVRQVKKLELENKKLHLEIAALQRTAELQERYIQVPTTDEVVKYARHRTRDSMPTAFARGRGPNPGPDDGPTPSKTGLTEWLILGGLAALALLFVGYLGYDLYRLGSWVHTLF